MAAESGEECSARMNEIDELVGLVWGKTVKEEVFKRWSQGMMNRIPCGTFVYSWSYSTI